MKKPVEYSKSLRQRAYEVNHLSIYLAEGFLCHHAAMTILKNPKAKDLFPEKPEGQAVSIGKFGNTDYTFDWYHKMAIEDKFIAQEFEKMWCVGAIYTLDDALKKNRHFDNGPILEMIHHLRNGVAHGNKFVFNNGIKYPANNFQYAKLTEMKRYEITHELKGKEVLFNFINAPDIYKLFRGVASHLNNHLKIDE